MTGSDDERFVAILSHDEVFALDIAETLEEDGYATWRYRKFESGVVDRLRRSRCLAGVIDDPESDPQYRRLLGWFRRQEIPIVLISHDTRSGVCRPVVAAFSKPLAPKDLARAITSAAADGATGRLARRVPRTRS